MQRRDFLKAGVSASVLSAAAASVASAAASTSGETPRELYELRAYRRSKEASATLLHRYFEAALLPALTARGLQRVGVFEELEAVDFPTLWVLIAHPSAQSAIDVAAELNAQAKVQASAGEYWTTPNKEHPAFLRIESSLHLAFSGHPQLQVPSLSKTRSERVFELRTYESFNEERALRKVQMFNSGEIGIMNDVGLGPVFFGQALFGHDLPQLTYLLHAANRAEHAAHWKAFGAHPLWQTMKSDPAYAETVSKITSRFLVPTVYSPL